MEIYGKGPCKLSVNGRSFFSGVNRACEIDLSDREAVTTSVTALDGTRHTTVKGEYINPKITVHYPLDIATLQSTLNSYKGKIVTFQPHLDNSSYQFTCRVINAYPENDGGAELQNFIIELESVGYVTTVGIVSEGFLQG